MVKNWQHSMMGRILALFLTNCMIWSSFSFVNKDNVRVHHKDAINIKYNDSCKVLYTVPVT